MTCSPTTIAREAAGQLLTRLNIATNETQPGPLADVTALILTAAARMVKESGAREALDKAMNGLQWYRGEYPEASSPADDEMNAEITAALANLAKLEGRG